MSDWWEKGYPGGPMIVVKGFPRPLYPPDAAPGHAAANNKNIGIDKYDFSSRERAHHIKPSLNRSGASVGSASILSASGSCASC